VWVVLRFFVGKIGAEPLYHSIQQIITVPGVVNVADERAYGQTGKEVKEPPINGEYHGGRS
jgi:hypothetical protein